MPDGTMLSSSTETKHERFIRLGTGRVQRALDAIEMVGKLATAENEYSEADAQRIVAALQERLDDTARRLAGKKPAKRLFSFE